MKQNALDIPELRLAIGSYLDQEGLKTCARVCQAWHIDFQPLVWARFNVDNTKLRKAQRKQRAARLESIHKNARWITHIERLTRLSEVDRVELYQILAENCRSLGSIDMSLLDEDEWDCYKRLVSLNHRLRQITIPTVLQASTFFDYQPVSLLAGHPFLQRLVLDCPTTIPTVMHVLEVCPTIEQVVIGRDKSSLQWRLEPCHDEILEAGVGHITLVDNANANANTNHQPSLFQLRQLKIEIPCNDTALATLLERSPSLRQLKLDEMSPQVCDAVCNILAGHRLPVLRSLTLKEHPCPPTGQQLALLDAFTPHQLQEVALLPAEPAGEVLTALVDHQHQTLELVYLVLLETHPESLASLLAQCLQLKSLILKMTNAVDIRHLIGQPWACTQLTELTMKVALHRRCNGSSSVPNMIEIAAAEKEEVEQGRREWEKAEAVFMKRIGTLTKLRRLELKTSTTQTDLTFTLANGLGHLAGLTQLEELVVSDRGRRQDIADMQFMKEHWPRMKKITFYSIRPNAKRWLKLRWPQLKVVELKSV